MGSAAAGGCQLGGLPAWLSSGLSGPGHWPTLKGEERRRMRAVLQEGSRRLQRQAPINPSKEGGFPGQQCHAPHTHPRGQAWSWAAGATQRGCRARPGLCSPAGPAHPAPGGCGRAQINPCSVPSQHPKQGEQSCCQAASPGNQGGSHATHHRQGTHTMGPWAVRCFSRLRIRSLPVATGSPRCCARAGKTL